MSADTWKAHVDQMNRVVASVKKSLGADILVYNGLLTEKDVEQAIQYVTVRNRQETVLLVLTTYGGDPDAAYMLARTLQRTYKRFIAYVPGFCKSAGTLVVLGAHELVLSAHAQLGPLDIQLTHTDEIGERRSGLAPTEALRVLETRARETYRKSFDDLRTKIRMPTRLAAETASRFVTGLYRSSFAHVDPIRLGEMDRANRIAHQYGERLVRSAGDRSNVKDGTLLKLVADYPSHEFVIDITEAGELFKIVREPTPTEAELDTVVASRRPLSEKTLTFFIDEPSPPTPEPTNGAAEQSDGAPPGSGGTENGADGATERAPVSAPVRNRRRRATPGPAAA